MSRIAFLVLASLLAFSALAVAQFGAALQGTITDPSGAVVPDVTVTLTNNETQRKQTGTTSADGVYRFTGLAPGNYTITAERAGFAPQTLANIAVRAEQTQGQNLSLVPASQTTEVTVTAPMEAALHTENANIGREISTQEVTRLPQYARDPYQLLRLAPNVTGDTGRTGSGNAVSLPNTTGPGGSNSSIFQTENQVPVSANGRRVSENNYQIDGVSVNSLTWGGAAVVTPNQESVKQMVIVTDPYSAQYGRNSGAQINVISQNGTNDFHGSAFFRYSSPGLNAYNRWGGPADAPVTRVNNLYRQFGGSVGGPVWKNKVFFFGSYEGLRSSNTSYYNAWVETPQYRQDVIAARANSVTASIFQAPGIEPRVVSVLQQPCPAGLLPNCAVVPGGLAIGSLNGGTGIYASGTTNENVGTTPYLQYAQIANPQTQEGNQYNARVDVNVTAMDTVAGSVYFTHLNNTGADTASGSRPMADLVITPLTSAATLVYNHIFSANFLNELRANFTRYSFNQVNSGTTVNWGIPRVEVEGLPFDRIRFGAPRDESTPGIFAQNTYEVRDYLNQSHGNHGLKYGAEIRWEQDNNNLAGGARPLYSFTGLFNLANDTPVFEAINADPNTGLPAAAQRYFRSRTYGLFVQDDWKVRPNLTLNLGLRWEYFTPLSETRGRLSNLQFASVGTLVGAKVGTVDQLFQPDRNNFGPRLGFAWSPRGANTNLVVRGGFGVFYDRTPDVLFANTRGNPPYFGRYNLCCGTPGSPFANGQILYALGTDTTPFGYPVNPALATGIDPATGAPNSGAVEVWGAQQFMPNPYSYIYSFQTEYSITRTLVASLGYSGSDAHRQVRIVNQNFLYPNNPAFFAVYMPQPDVNGNYNAFLAVLTRTLHNGVQFQTSYRWSKSLDQLSYGGPGASTNQTYPQDLHSEYGPSDYDARHYFKLSALWEVPSRYKSGLAGALLGGWELNPIIVYHTGYPWTPKIGQSVSTPGGPSLGPIRPTVYYGGAGNDMSNSAFMTGSNFPVQEGHCTANAPGACYFNITASGPPGVGRNSMRGPQFFQTDLSFGKMTRMPWTRAGESTGLELRADVYNLFNQTNLSPFGFFSAGTFADNPNFGKADAALAGRVVQLQARFSF